MYVVIDTLYLSREHIELENLRGEHTRVLEETKKEKVTFCVSVPLVFDSASSNACLCFPALAAAEQPVRDGENEGGAREEEVLLGTGGAQRKGKGFRDINRRE